jgi:hypothetical protein
MIFISTSSASLIKISNLQVSITNVREFNHSLTHLLLGYCGLSNNTKVTSSILKDIFLALQYIRIGGSRDADLVQRLEFMFRNKRLPLGWQGILRFLPTSGSRYITRNIPINFSISEEIHSKVKHLSNDSGSSGLLSSLEILSRELVNTRGSKHEPYSMSFSSDIPRNFVLGNYFMPFDNGLLTFKHNCMNTDMNTSVALVHILGISPDFEDDNHLEKVLGLVTTIEMDEISYAANLNSSFDFFLFSSREPKPASGKDSQKKETSNNQDQIDRSNLSNLKVTMDPIAFENLFNKYVSVFEDKIVARINTAIQNVETPSLV